jgi:hypothetical protein
MAGMLIEGVGMSRYEELAEKMGIEGDSEEFGNALEKEKGTACK